MLNFNQDVHPHLCRSSSYGNTSKTGGYKLKFYGIPLRQNTVNQWITYTKHTLTNTNFIDRS